MSKIKHTPLTVGPERDNLREINAELLAQLETALECIRYCRRTHPDPQKGDGIPVEFFISETIAKAKATP